MCVTVCRRCATDKIFERNYIVHVDTCSSSQLTRFQYIREGKDPRDYSLMVPVYIQRDRLHNIVTINAENSTQVLLSEVDPEFEISKNNHSPETLGRRELVPCRDLQTLKSLPETKRKQKMKEQENTLYRHLMKAAKLSQDVTAYVFDCDRHGFDDNYLKHTSDMFFFFVGLTITAMIL